jgi:hypothetical protein
VWKVSRPESTKANHPRPELVWPGHRAVSSDTAAKPLKDHCAQPARGAASNTSRSTSNGLDAPQEQRVTCVEATCITSPDVLYEALPLNNGTCNVPTRYDASNRDK